MEQHYDVAVIGAGPGGYVAAIRASQLGKKVLVVDSLTNPDNGEQAALGGTCANVGCIPSKALLASGLAYVRAREGSPKLGVTTDPASVKLDIAAVQAHRAATVRATNAGVQYLFRKNKVSFVSGRAEFAGSTVGGWALAVKTEKGESAVVATHVIVACGSRARSVAGAEFDENVILSNVGALRLSSVPARLGIIGAGVIGLELGSVWQCFGSEVTVLEFLPNLLPLADETISRQALRIFTARGITLEFGARVTAVEKKRRGVAVRYTDAGGEERVKTFDRLIIAAGRAPAADSVNPGAVGLELDRRGFIKVDDECRTNLENVWAIGDAVRGPMLAHKASEEGVAVAERIAGRPAFVNLNLVPAVIYTDPEIAFVGLTESAAKEAGCRVRCASVPYSANGRARAVSQTEGTMKIVADADTDRILGVHIIGADAAELIGEACAALAFGATCEDLSLVCHAHPTFAESLKECALAVRGEAINL